MKPFDELTYLGQVRRLRRLAAEMLARYPLTDPAFTLLSHGFNTTFRVRAAEGEYMLRISRLGLHTPAELRSELVWLDAIRRDTDLLVPQPIRNRVADLLTTADVGGVPHRHGMLFGWIDGRFRKFEHLQPRHLHRVGRLMAALHDHVQHQFVPPADFERERIDGDRVPDFERMMAGDVATAEDKTTFQAAYDRIRAETAPLPRTPDAYNLIHTDLHYMNYLFVGDRAVAIDFDDTAWGHFAYDAAVTLWYVRRHERFDELRTGFWDGYTAAGRPIPAGVDVYIHFRSLRMAVYLATDTNPTHDEVRRPFVARAAADLRQNLLQSEEERA